MSAIMDLNTDARIDPQSLDLTGMMATVNHQPDGLFRVAVFDTSRAKSDVVYLRSIPCPKQPPTCDERIKPGYSAMYGRDRTAVARELFRRFLSDIHELAHEGEREDHD